jgi:hypothetical protein
MPSTTAEEVQLAFQEREAAVQTRLAKLKASEAGNVRPIEVKEPAADATEQAAPAAVPSAASGSEHSSGKPNGDGGLGQAEINTFFKSVEDRVKQASRHRETYAP